MTRKLLTASVAAGLLIGAALVQAEGTTASDEAYVAAKPVVDHDNAGGGVFQDPAWIETPPFPRSFGGGQD